MCIWGLCKSSCGLWESQPSAWLCFAVLVELCHFSEILSGTLANDPIKTCITIELTRDYTLWSTPEEHATLSHSGTTHCREWCRQLTVQAITRGFFFPVGDTVCTSFISQEINKFFLYLFWLCYWEFGVIYVPIAFHHLFIHWAKGKEIPWKADSLCLDYQDNSHLWAMWRFQSEWSACLKRNKLPSPETGSWDHTQFYCKLLCSLCCLHHLFHLLHIWKTSKCLKADFLGWHVEDGAWHSFRGKQNMSDYSRTLHFHVSEGTWRGYEAAVICSLSDQIQRLAETKVQMR